VEHWRKAWDYIQPWDVERFGEVIFDPQERRRWGAIYSIGGGLAYMWRELAAPMREFLTSLLELRPGDKVLVIGEALQPCGFVEDVEARIGPEGEVRSFEIIEEARQRVFAGQRGANGKLGTWRWDYADQFPNEYFDCVYIPQAIQHSEDWKVAAPDLLRVMKSGRRIVLSEIGFGPEYQERMRADFHIWALNDRMAASAGRPRGELSYWSPAQLHEAFEGLVSEADDMEWKGLEMFWARKR
jgi:SAM-dependent methyltransferase